MKFAPVGQEEAGLIAIQNDLSVFLMAGGGGTRGQLVAGPIEGDAVFLKITGGYLSYDFQRLVPQAGIR